MPLLVEASEVRAVVDTVRDDADLISFIETANLIVTEQLDSSVLSATRLKQIELYLAAHFTAITFERGGLTTDETGDDSAGFSDAYANGGLSLTRFGQIAVQLDTTGVLQGVNESASLGAAKFEVV